MRLRIVVLCLFAGLTLGAQTPSAADAWKTAETLGNVDLSELTPVQKKAVLKILREEDCSCQCGMKTAECILKDTNCSYSRTIAKIAIQGVKDGKSLMEISKLMDASPKAHRPKLLEDPVTIAVEGAPVRGPADARITLVEFSDFECPFCSLAVKQVDTVMAAYPKDVKLIYKQFPLSMHPHAEMAAEASLAAREQGKFWEMYDVLFKNYRRLSSDSILGFAKDIGLDMDKFKADLAAGKYKAVVDKDLADGEAAGVYGTPSFYINGKQYNGEVTLAALKPILAAELKGENKEAAAAK
ncbi:MAG TPA: thioredoxin domain-containing protein [Bryobacteraceae bacterium]|jgi:protein-disulfide isomerase|nr:thioredoxin domain-containing protein [Bryobacteraceae bacterium]